MNAFSSVWSGLLGKGNGEPFLERQSKTETESVVSSSFSTGTSSSVGSTADGTKKAIKAMAHPNKTVYESESAKRRFRFTFRVHSCTNLTKEPVDCFLVTRLEKQGAVRGTTTNLLGDTISSSTMTLHPSAAGSAASLSIASSKQAASRTAAGAHQPDGAAEKRTSTTTKLKEGLRNLLDDSDPAEFGVSKDGTFLLEVPGSELMLSYADLKKTHAVIDIWEYNAYGFNSPFARASICLFDAACSNFSHTIMFMRTAKGVTYGAVSMKAFIAVAEVCQYKLSLENWSLQLNGRARRAQQQSPRADGGSGPAPVGPEAEYTLQVTLPRSLDTHIGLAERMSNRTSRTCVSGSTSERDKKSKSGQGKSKSEQDKSKSGQDKSKHSKGSDPSFNSGPGANRSSGAGRGFFGSCGPFGFQGTQTDLGQSFAYVTVSGKVKGSLGVAHVIGRGVMSLNGLPETSLFKCRLKNPSQFIAGVDGSDGYEAGQLVGTVRCSVADHEYEDEVKLRRPRPPANASLYDPMKVNVNWQYLVLRVSRVVNLPETSFQVHQRGGSSDAGDSSSWWTGTNPFLVLRFNGGSYVSPAQRFCTRPKFDHMFVVPIRVVAAVVNEKPDLFARELLGLGNLQLEVWSKHVTSSDFLGSVTIDLADIVTTKIVRERTVFPGKPMSVRVLEFADDPLVGAHVKSNSGPGLVSMEAFFYPDISRAVISAFTANAAAAASSSSLGKVGSTAALGSGLLSANSGLLSARDSGFTASFVLTLEKKWKRAWAKFINADYLRAFPDAPWRSRGRSFPLLCNNPTRGKSGISAVPLSCLISPLVTPQELNQPAFLLHWVSSISVSRLAESQASGSGMGASISGSSEGTGSNSSDPETSLGSVFARISGVGRMMSSRSGSRQDQALLLCCVLLGLNYDAYVCKGLAPSLIGGVEGHESLTSKPGSPQSEIVQLDECLWVMTVHAETNCVVLWDVESCRRFVLPSRVKAQGKSRTGDSNRPSLELSSGAAPLDSAQLPDSTLDADVDVDEDESEVPRTEVPKQRGSAETPGSDEVPFPRSTSPMRESSTRRNRGKRASEVVPVISDDHRIDNFDEVELSLQATKFEGSNKETLATRGHTLRKSAAAPRKSVNQKSEMDSAAGDENQTSSKLLVSGALKGMDREAFNLEMNKIRMTLPFAPCMELLVESETLIEGVPFESLEVVFNHEVIYANRQNAHPCAIYYNLRDAGQWELAPFQASDSSVDPVTRKTELRRTGKELVFEDSSGIVPLPPAVDPDVNMASRIDPALCEKLTANLVSELAENVRMFRSRVGLDTKFEDSSSSIYASLHKYMGFREDCLALDSDVFYSDPVLSNSDLADLVPPPTSPYQSPFTKNSRYCKDQLKKWMRVLREYTVWADGLETLPIRRGTTLTATPIRFTTASQADIRDAFLSWEPLVQVLNSPAPGIYFLISARMFSYYGGVISTWVTIACESPSVSGMSKLK